MSIRRWAIAMISVAGLAGLTACGDDGDSAKKETSGKAGGSVQVKSVDGKEALTDGAGRVLYLFTKDTANKTNCAGECLAKWPALAGPVTAGEKADAGKLGTITRPEGTSQVTYAGKPLYYFAKDKKPGDKLGQGLLGVWYLMDADGEAIRP